LDVGHHPALNPLAVSQHTSGVDHELIIIRPLFADRQIEFNAVVFVKMGVVRIGAVRNKGRRRGLFHLRRKIKKFVIGQNAEGGSRRGCLTGTQHGKIPQPRRLPPDGLVETTIHHGRWDRRSRDDRFRRSRNSETPGKPAGIYGATDRIAFGILEACRKRNLHVPSDVAVVGTNADDILCQLATPELSSVDAASFQVGYHAAHMLDYLMGRSSSAPELCLIPPGPIHVRASSDNLADTDPDLAAAIRFIREHATEPIYVPDVVRANRLSRRSLEILFRKFLNRSIADEIRLAQVNNVKSLLEKTSLTISEIARLSGFSSAVSLEAAFQKFLATSATAYRKASVSAAPGGAP
jgi:AraC-like DNA-binding protein